MNPHFPRLAGYLARLLPVLAGCLCHGLLLVGAANAAVPSPEHSSGFVYLVLALVILGSGVAKVRAVRD